MSETAETGLQLVARQVSSYAKNMVNDERAKQFVTTLAIISKNKPELSNCKPEAVLAAMMACIHLDLMPNTPEGYAYLIPYNGQVQFQVGYKGLIELCYRSGMMKAVNAELVFPEDKFEIKLGTERILVHEPSYNIDRTDYKRVTQVYATALMSNGTNIFEVMGMQEIDKVRKTSKAKSTDSPWNTWPESMAKKTVLKRMLKYLPSSGKDNRLQYATTYDSWAEAGRLAIKEGELAMSEDVQIGDLLIPKFEKPEAKSPEAKDTLSKLSKKLEGTDESGKE